MIYKRDKYAMVIIEWEQGIIFKYPSIYPQDILE